MRIPVSWLRDHAQLPEDDAAPTADQIADAFVRAGLEVEAVHHLGPVTGPLVVGRVTEIEELAGFAKPIRYCLVDDGEPAPRGVVCGATNFAVGDLVVLARPGTVLPGGVTIGARTTYGRTSDGMICSAAELGLGDDHTGIIVLAADAAIPGASAVDVLGLDDAVIELAITPDRGYCLSARGLARELAVAFDVPYRDPALLEVPPAQAPSWPVHIEDDQGCRRFVVRQLSGLHPGAESPWWMRRRLYLAGMRPISLAVDVTNYVMLELGQPMHAFDAGKLDGDLVVRRATEGEKLITLDGVCRELDSDDIVICDASGPISLAAVMGGESTEVGPQTTNLLLEAANWNPASVARAARRHKLPSEAARRFERGVDPALAPAAAELAAALLTRHGGGVVLPGRTDVGTPPAPLSVVMPIDEPDRVAGRVYDRGVTVRRLSQIGCGVHEAGTHGTAMLTVVPPSWRPDLVQPADLVEEVLRLEGYDTIPSTLPPAPPGRGLSAAQRRRRMVSRALASAGYVEVQPSPFVSSSTWDAFGLPDDDPRRHTTRLINPLESDRDELATTLLPGLLEVLVRNVARGQRDVALYGMAPVVLPRHGGPAMPDVGVLARPSNAEVAALMAALPEQPLHVGTVLAGQWERRGWWGTGRPATWADAIQAGRLLGRAAGVELEVSAAHTPPWHSGRCGALQVDGHTVGHAGELHPAVVEALALPPRTCAMELDLDALPLTDKRPAPLVSPYPPVLQDIALVVDAAVPVAELTATLRRGAGELLEDVRLFDVYTGDQIGPGKRSLAFALRFRAPDRTLTVAEATAARDAAVAAAATTHGATLRS
ncbi:MAG: phenylalanine--tRNA ligase subunit beta [Pseudonocardiales bacterium]|nr:phenylalanine--tRNA ligase subunit beta [Pseudonocardiales bacterium]MBV9652105.1 phenylalanine--tRNA ligase subunit beta [Pseudonocardiales bacterium]